MSDTKMTPEALSAALGQFHGSETFTKWSPLFPRDVLTEGARFLAEQAGAYWLMDAIASHQHYPKVRKEEFQVWHLVRRGEATWLLICEDGNDVEVARQEIAFSDFPLAAIKLFACRNELGGITIMMPGER